jgi:hypothetical protein
LKGADNSFGDLLALKKKVCLEVKDASTDNGATIQLGGNADEGKDQPNRRWRFRRMDVK